MSLATESRTKIDPLHTVDNAVYIDEQVFEREQDNIFARTWIFVAHVSQLRNTGDYVKAVIAGSSIVATRDDKGTLRAFYNICRHRASTLVADNEGQCKQFQCPYHLWTYTLDGRLVGMPEKKGVYDHQGGFNLDEFGLVPVRIAEVCGLVFVCLADDAPSLEEHLGPSVVQLLQHPFGSTDLEILAHRRKPMQANWKNYAENGRDGYHAPYLHSLLRRASPPRRYDLLPNSHAVQWIAREGETDPVKLAALRKNPIASAQATGPYIMNVYPNLLVVFQGGGVMSLQTVYPWTVSTSELHLRGLAPRGEDEKTRKERMEAWEAWVYELNLNEDVPAIEQQQIAFGTRPRGVLASLINRDAQSGEAMRGDDGRLRQFWKRWRSDLKVPFNSFNSRWDEVLQRGGY